MRGDCLRVREPPARRKYKKMRGTNKQIKGNAGIFKIMEVQVENSEVQEAISCTSTLS